MDTAYIYVEIKFYKSKRKTVPYLRTYMYCPHFVVKGTTEYLGVRFVEGDDVEFDKICHGVAELMYDGVDYSTLTVHTQFFIMEGANTVGEGKIVEYWKN